MTLGPMIIADDRALAAAAHQIEIVGRSLARDGVEGILISGFGDPGLCELRDRLDIAVVGIAEAGMAEAARYGRFPLSPPRRIYAARSLGRWRATDMRMAWPRF